MTSPWEQHIQESKAAEEASRLLDRNGMYELHGLVHQLWSKAVGTSDYDKAEWKRMEELVGKAFRTILGSECDRLGYMAMITPDPISQAATKLLCKKHGYYTCILCTREDGGIAS